MLLYGALIVGLQLFCGVHCVQHCRTRSWLFLILFFPLVGSLIYLIAEVLPQWQAQGSRARRYQPQAGRYRPSARELDRLKDEVRFSNTVQNRENLADEYARQNLYAEAVGLYRECLSGPLENDPSLLYKLAEASYGQGDYAQSLEALHRIRAISDYRPAKVRLLLARSYEAAGQFDKAHQAYEQALKAHGELEIKCRYALFLQAQGQTTRATELLQEVQLSGERMQPQLRKLNQVWLDLARKHLKSQMLGQPALGQVRESAPEGSEPA